MVEMSSNKKVFLKMILQGDSSVGKTCLMKKFVNGKFLSQYKATTETDFVSKEVTVGDRKIVVQVFDTTGKEKVPFYKGVDCCVLVFDVTDFDTFKSLDRWRNEFIIKAAPQDPENFPFVVLGNKVDLDAREISTKQATQWCESNNIPYFETSAKDGYKVHRALLEVAKVALVQHNSTMDLLDEMELSNTGEPSENGDSCAC